MERDMPEDLERWLRTGNNDPMVDHDSMIQTTKLLYRIGWMDVEVHADGQTATWALNSKAQAAIARAGSVSVALALALEGECVMEDTAAMCFVLDWVMCEADDMPALAAAVELDNLDLEDILTAAMKVLMLFTRAYAVEKGVSVETVCKEMRAVLLEEER